MKIQIIVLCLFTSLIECTINFQLESICSQIVRNRKKQGGVKNAQFKQSLKKLNQTLHDDCIVELEPRYFWAQNMSFIMVKFDFQISSSTSCSQILLSQKTVNHQGFYIKQFCLQSDQIIKYTLNVKTFKNMNFHFSKWKQTQMNGLILESLKSPAPYFWSKLYSKSNPPKNKPRIWWQLQQRQDQSVQKYMSLLQIDESQVQISSYVKKMKKKILKKQNSKHYHSDIQFYCNQGSPYFHGSWY